METLELKWRYGVINAFVNDSVISDSIILYGEWAQKEIEFLNYLVCDKIDPTIIFGGANIGVQTIAMSKLLQDTNAEIHSFEIHPSIYKTLELNLRINNCLNVVSYSIGLSNSEGNISLPGLKEEDNMNIGSFSLHKTYKDTDSFQVRLKTIDSLKLKSCSLIHLDVEKHELSCLKGAEETIKSFQPDVYAEVLNQNSAIEIFDFLKEYYKYCYLHFSNAYNGDNYKKETKDIFSANKECSFVCSNRQLYHTELYDVSSHGQIEKLFKTIYSYRKSSSISGEERVYSAGDDQYILQLYVDSGSGYQERESIVEYINSSSASISLDLSEYADILNLRLDPHSSNCIVKLNDICVTTDNGIKSIPIIEGSNYYLAFDSYYLFDNLDPRLILGNISELTDIKSLNFTIEYFSLDEGFVKVAFEKLNMNNKLLAHRLEELSRDLASEDQLNIKFLKRHLVSLEEMTNGILDQTSIFNKEVGQREENVKNILIEHRRDIILHSNQLHKLLSEQQVDFSEFSKQLRALTSTVTDLNNELYNKILNLNLEVNSLLSEAKIESNRISNRLLSLEDIQNRPIWRRLFGAR